MRGDGAIYRGCAYRVPVRGYIQRLCLWSAREGLYTEAVLMECQGGAIYRGCVYGVPGRG